MSFDTAVVMFTGAGARMGRCNALELARRRARVVVNDARGHPFGGGGDPNPAETVVEGHLVARR